MNPRVLPDRPEDTVFDIIKTDPFPFNGNKLFVPYATLFILSGEEWTYFLRNSSQAP
jgi:hypothetical protein